MGRGTHIPHAEFCYFPYFILATPTTCASFRQYFSNNRQIMPNLKQSEQHSITPAGRVGRAEPPSREGSAQSPYRTERLLEPRHFHPCAPRKAQPRCRSSLAWIGQPAGGSWLSNPAGLGLQIRTRDAAIRRTNRLAAAIAPQGMRIIARRAVLACGRGAAWMENVRPPYYPQKCAPKLLSD